MLSCFNGTSVSSKLDDQNFPNPSIDPQVQQVQQGFDPAMITNLGTVITISVATVMTEITTKKIFVSKKATTMLHLLGSYSIPNKNQVETLIPGKFTNKFDQIMNTKNKYEATIGFQSALTSTANDLTNSLDLGLTCLYMDPNAKTYNVPRVEKLKTFGFINNGLNQSLQV